MARQTDVVPLGSPKSKEADVFRRIISLLGLCPKGVPSGSASLEYMAEGAANTVWIVRFHADSNMAAHDSAYILRLRKDLPTYSARTTVAQIEERITPLFKGGPDLLLPLHICQLSAPTVERLDSQLRHLETSGVRPAERHGTYHPTFSREPEAILMPNLRHGPGLDIELKPKWLVQSPSAPHDARRCRTCALSPWKRQKGSGSGKGDMGACPLHLLSDDDSEDGELATTLANIWPGGADDAVGLAAFTRAFRDRVQPSLRFLQGLQQQRNAVGLHHFQRGIQVLEQGSKEPKQRQDFEVAMAIRDCSIFIKAAPSPDGRSVDIRTVRLIDLDCKCTDDAKLTKWSRVEGELISGGWYAAHGYSDVHCAVACN